MGFNPYKKSNYDRIKKQEKERREEKERKEREKEIARMKSQPWLSLVGLKFKENGEVVLLHQIVEYVNRSIKHSEVEEIPFSKFWDWNHKQIKYHIDMKKISKIKVNPLRTHKVMEAYDREGEGEYKDWISLDYFVQSRNGGYKEYAEEINKYLKKIGNEHVLSQKGLILPPSVQELIRPKEGTASEGDLEKLKSIRLFELGSGYIVSFEKLIKALDDLSEIDTYETSKQKKVIKYLSDNASVLGTQDYSIYDYSEVYENTKEYVVDEDEVLEEKVGGISMRIYPRNRTATEIYHSTNEVATALNLLLRVLNGENIKSLLMTEKDCLIYNSRVSDFTRSRLYGSKNLNMDVFKCPFDILFHQKVRYILKDTGHSKPLSNVEKQILLNKLDSVLLKLKKRLGGKQKVIQALMKNTWFSYENHPEDQIIYKNKTFINCSFSMESDLKFENCTFKNCYIVEGRNQEKYRDCIFINCIQLERDCFLTHMLYDIRLKNNIGTERKTYRYFTENNPKILAIHRIIPDGIHSNFAPEKARFPHKVSKDSWGLSPDGMRYM